MKVTLMIFCCLLSLTSCSQKLSEADQVSREKAESVLNSKLINDKIEGKNHIVFSVADRDFIVLVEESKSFREYYLKATTESQSYEILDNAVVEISDELVEIMFDKNAYKTGFITFDSDFYKSGYEISSGNITYFAFKDKQGERFGEARLSMLIKPNPIDTSIYSYFVKRMIDYNKTM